MTCLSSAALGSPKPGRRNSWGQVDSLAFLPSTTRISRTGTKLGRLRYILVSSAPPQSSRTSPEQYAKVTRSYTSQARRGHDRSELGGPGKYEGVDTAVYSIVTVLSNHIALEQNVKLYLHLTAETFLEMKTTFDKIALNCALLDCLIVRD